MEGSGLSGKQSRRFHGNRMAARRLDGIVHAQPTRAAHANDDSSLGIRQNKLVLRHS
jgi:hypothetical protein